MLRHEQKNRQQHILIEELILAKELDGRVIETRTFRRLAPKEMQSGRSTTEPHAPEVAI
jgi:hypothetical protein